MISVGPAIERSPAILMKARYDAASEHLTARLLVPE